MSTKILSTHCERTAIQGVLFAFLAHQRYSWARVGWPTRTDTIRLLRRATGLLLLAFLGGVAARIEYPLVNWISGPQDTAHYFLGQKLFLVYASLVAVIGNSIWAPAADLFHRGESGRLIVQLDRALRGTAVVGTAGAVAIAGVTPTFLRLWLGEGFDPGSLARFGFAVSFPLLGLNVLLASVLTATGHTRAMLVSTATYFAVTVIAQCWLGQVAGPGGIAWGTAIGVCAAVAVNLAVASRVFGLSAIGAGMRLLMVALLGCCYGLGFATLLDLLPRMGWIELVAVMGLGWGGFLMLAVQLILTREDRHEIHSRLFRR
ncbi:MAG TPA: polysaccharide biosynthesis C-terminal domain-containing protein [Gemmata sp.]|nr:polysaccharide biosynthesis C-terminal domain-containing protein [Gemmata sp.]